MVFYTTSPKSSHVLHTGRARQLKKVLDEDIDEKLGSGELVELGLVPVEKEYVVDGELREIWGWMTVVIGKRRSEARWLKVQLENSIIVVFGSGFTSSSNLSYSSLRSILSLRAIVHSQWKPH